MSAANNNQKGAVGGSSRGNGDDARGRRGYPEDENSEEGRRAAEADTAAKKRARDLAEIQRMQARITEAARHQIEMSRNEEQQAKKQIEDMEHLDSSKVVAYARKMGVSRSVVAEKPEERGAPPGSIIKVRKVATSGSLVGSGKCKACIRFGDDCISKTLTNGDNSCYWRTQTSPTPVAQAQVGKVGRVGRPEHAAENPNVEARSGRETDPRPQSPVLPANPAKRPADSEGASRVVLRHFLLQLLQAKGEEEFHRTRVQVAEEIRDFEPGFSWAMSHRPVAPVWYHYSESTPIGPLNEGEHGFLPRLPPIDTWGLYPAKSPSEERELEADLVRYDAARAKAKEFILGSLKDGGKEKEKENEDDE
ncbi:hypothetical protein B0H16DRAFT_1452482 [Mycena metata]|uniref:Uncharacterized protein n=1 Tax=Mycena metata TaxID=1033252 RepID=A0AAD7JRK9_9AGAR|nr:hypothetical protein B0H16DRAFT_1452482 [Mycena metata]